MLKWIRNRLIGYEVFFQRDGRWSMELVTDDEEAAIAAARKALGGGKVTGAKVVRQRSMLSGFTTETVVLEEYSNQPKEKPIIVVDAPVPTALCADIDDLFRAPSRLLVSIVLRDWLSRQNVTATELLHGWSHIRKIQDKSEVLTAAIHRISTGQSKTTGEPVKDRVVTLLTLVEQGSYRARDFLVERKRLPNFPSQGVAAFAAEVEKIVGPERTSYTLAALLTVELFDLGTIPAKLEAAVGFLAEDGVAPQTALSEVLDGVVADCLVFAETLHDLFGNQPNLGAFLTVLADVVRGIEPTGEGLNPVLPRLAQAVGRGLAPHSADILVSRLAQELGGDRPLDRTGSEREAAVLDRLFKTLTLEGGVVIGGEPVRKALSVRRMRQRQAVLRAQGLHGIADNLRAE